jgi:ubiquinone/menaquinone biosynthesis C-methylase UbiE
MAETRYQLAGNAPQLYERETVHTLGRPSAELMLARVPLRAGDRVLDAACGTGIVTRVAVQRYGDLGHVIGVDLNAGMLDVARANSPATRVPIEWRQADVCALPFSDARFEVVLCQQGLQFVPVPSVALREMRRVLVPGGRLACTVFSEIPAYYAALAEALARHVSADAATSCLSRYTVFWAMCFATSSIPGEGFGVTPERAQALITEVVARVLAGYPLPPCTPKKTNLSIQGEPPQE